MRTDKNFYKVLHVLRSCRTQEHFEVAANMMGNYIKMNSNDRDIYRNMDRYWNIYYTLRENKGLHNILG